MTLPILPTPLPPLPPVALPWNADPQIAAMCRSSVQACCQMAYLGADCVAQVQKIGLEFARSSLIKGLAVAEDPGEDHVRDAAIPEFGDWLGLQRDVGAVLVDASQQWARAMSDYSSRVAAALDLAVPDTRQRRAA